MRSSVSTCSNRTLFLCGAVVAMTLAALGVASVAHKIASGMTAKSRTPAAAGTGGVPIKARAENPRVGVPPAGRIVYAMVSPGQTAWKLYLQVASTGKRAESRPREVRLIPSGSYRPGGFLVSPVFSPDGKQVLLMGDHRTGPGTTPALRQDPYKGTDLWIVDLRNAHVRPLTKDSAGYMDACWSPDGRYISALSLEGRSTQDVMPDTSIPTSLYMWDVRSGRRRLLAPDASKPRWSPDSRRLLYGSSSPISTSLMSVGVHDGSRRTLLRTSHPAWLGDCSPVGGYIAYSIAYRKGCYVMVMQPGHRLHRRLLTTRWPVQQMRWSPDGRSLALVSRDTRAEHGEYVSKLVVVALSSGRPRELGRMLGESTIVGWSLDSRWVVATRRKAVAAPRDKLDALPLEPWYRNLIGASPAGPTYREELIAVRVRDGRRVVLQAPSGYVAGFDWNAGKKGRSGGGCAVSPNTVGESSPALAKISEKPERSLALRGKGRPRKDK